MRYTEIDLQCEDIMWFGVDSNGYIFECTSAGCGNVPEYVCRSKEETQKLLDYFIEEAPEMTSANLLISDADNQLVDEVRDLASKGVYCFDITDYNKDDVYTCIAKPITPTVISSLPTEIQSLLSDHIYEGDISSSQSITVKHAY